MSQLLSADKRFANKSPKAIAIALRKATRPQTIFLASGSLAFPLVIYACALVNVVFWGNLSQWTLQDYTTKNKITGEFERASLKKRTLYSGGLALLGLGITSGFLLVGRKVVKRIDMLSGGKQVAVHTGFFGRETSTVGIHIPLEQLSLKRGMYTGQGPNLAKSSTSTFAHLSRQNQLIGYLVDRQGHFLGSPRVLDELFYRST